MRLILLLVCIRLFAMSAVAGVLIVADEFPAMEVVAASLKREEHIESTLLSQKELPANLDPYEAVVVYIHGPLSEKAENVFIDYTRDGGKLVLLHHSISSGKRKNTHWFKFLGVALPEGNFAQGGYKWIEGVNFELVNLHPDHFIMTNQVRYPDQISYRNVDGASDERRLPGFKLEGSEVYLNHVHTEPRTLLMGLKYTDSATHTNYMQNTAGWLMRAGKGCIIYFMPGHTKQDFENPTYGRIVVNAVICKP